MRRLLLLLLALVALLVAALAVTHPHAAGDWLRTAYHDGQT